MLPWKQIFALQFTVGLSYQNFKSYVIKNIEKSHVKYTLF